MASTLEEGKKKIRRTFSEGETKSLEGYAKARPYVGRGVQFAVPAAILGSFATPKGNIPFPTELPKSNIGRAGAAAQTIGAIGSRAGKAVVGAGLGTGAFGAGVADKYIEEKAKSHKELKGVKKLLQQQKEGSMNRMTLKEKVASFDTSEDAAGPLRGRNPEALFTRGAEEQHFNVINNFTQKAIDASMEMSDKTEKQLKELFANADRSYGRIRSIGTSSSEASSMLNRAFKG